MGDTFIRASVDDEVDDRTAGSLVSLRALCLKMQQVFSLSEFLIIQDDDVIGAIKKSRGNTNDTDSVVNLYPFGFLRISSVGINEEGPNAKIVARVGSGQSVTPDMTSATVIKHYKFWSMIEGEMEFRFSSLADAISFAERLSIVLAVGALNTGVLIDDGMDGWTVIVQGSKMVSLPMANREDASKPAIYVVTHPVTVKSQIGDYKEVPKINNEGRIDTSVVVGNAPAENSNG